nr:MAG TPA: hypothetical protein [Caudoviricetes sp.]
MIEHFNDNFFCSPYVRPPIFVFIICERSFDFNIFFRTSLLIIRNLWAKISVF